MGTTTGDYDADASYDYAGDAYGLWWRGFGRDSMDGAGWPMDITVHSTSYMCPNAWWDGSAVTFCDGYATDDIVAHEFGHNLGLPHCPNKGCIMEDAKGTVSTKARGQSTGSTVSAPTGTAFSGMDAPAASKAGIRVMVSSR